MQHPEFQARELEVLRLSGKLAMQPSRDDPGFFTIVSVYGLLVLLKGRSRVLGLTGGCTSKKRKRAQVVRAIHANKEKVHPAPPSGKPSHGG